MRGKRASGLWAPPRANRPSNTMRLSPRGHKPRVPMIAFADQDLVALCRFARYAERFPRSPAERRSRARKIGITLGRPVNATPLVTVWRSLRKPGYRQYRRLLLVPSRRLPRRSRDARLTSRASSGNRRGWSEAAVPIRLDEAGPRWPLRTQRGRVAPSTAGLPCLCRAQAGDLSPWMARSPQRSPDNRARTSYGRYSTGSSGRTPDSGAWNSQTAA
jgi:hypothetical protein